MDMQNDDRKRSFDNTDSSQLDNFQGQETQGKRIRQPEEILGIHEDSRRPSTRLLITRQEFSKVIGKGGSNISQIRSKCGAGVKGVDVDENTRILVISGLPRQVLEAFEMVSENLYQHHLQSMLNPTLFTLQMLLDNQKAGRVIGPSGSNIQALKSRAGANQLRVQKELREFSPGVSLRVLVAEGSLNSVRRIHYEIMAQLVDPSQLTAGGSGHGAIDSGMYQLGSLSLNGGVPVGSGGHYGSAPTLSPAAESLPFNSLISFGLQAETVRQLSEMKVYLQRQFGLDLTISVSKDNSQAKSMGQGESAFYAQQQGMVHPHPAAMNPPVAVSAQPQWGTYGNGNQELAFSVPLAVVGAVIGKEGRILKELQVQFDVRVYVEKLEVAGTRRVVIRPNTNSSSSSHADGSGPVAGHVSSSMPLTDEDRNKVQACADHILDLIQQQQQQVAK